MKVGQRRMQSHDGKAPKGLETQMPRLELLGLQLKDQAAMKDPSERTSLGTAQKGGVVCRVKVLEAHRSRCKTLSAEVEEQGLLRRSR